MEYCEICGAPLSEGNTTGIGYECRAALYAAKRYKAKKDGLSLKLYIYEVSLYKGKFIELYTDKSFRSEFRKSFFQSIKTSERISKKQLDIIKNIMLEKYAGCSFWDEFRKNINKFEEDEIERTQVTRLEIESARKFIRSNKD